MLSNAEAALVSRESVLPNLHYLLDETLFRALLQQALPGQCIDAVRREYIRYKPGMNCLVKYAVRSDAGPLACYAKLYGTDAEIKLKKAFERPTYEPLPGFGRLVLQKEQMLICAYPNDDKLKYLRRLLKPKLCSSILKSAIGKDAASGATFSSLQYKPERRYVSHVVSPNGLNAALKMYTRKAYGAALRNAQYAYQHQPSLFPPVIGYADQYQVLLLAWLPGQNLSYQLDAGQVTTAQMRAVGRALAQLHAVPPHIDLAFRGVNFWRSKLFQVAKMLDFLLSPQTKLHQLVDSISTALDTLSPKICVVHNDFYAKQVLCQQDSISIVDTDDLGLGFSAWDLGLFIGRLERDVILGRLTIEQANMVANALCAGYEDAGNDIDHVAVKLFTSIALITLLHYPFRSCLPDWPAKIKALIDEAAYQFEQYQALVKKHRHSRRDKPQEHLPSDAQRHTKADPMMPMLDQALSVEGFSRHFHGLLPDSTAFHTPAISEIQVLNHRRGRRCALVYTLVPRGGDPQRLVGKIQAKKLDTRAYYLNRFLYEHAGFHEAAVDGIHVPKPIGMIAPLNMWCQQWVDGQAIFKLMGGVKANFFARRVAEAIYKLHQAEVETDKAHYITDELNILDQQLNIVAQQNESWRARIQQLLSLSKTLSLAIPPTRPVGIHRDFYHDQLLAKDEHIYLLDLDLYCQGDAALDLGNFIAHIEEQCLREFDDIDRYRPVLETLITHYCSISGKPIQPSIDIYTQLSLVRHVAISQRIPDRRPYTEAIMNVCESRMGARS